MQSVFVAKGRPATDPLIVHGPSLEALEPVVDGWPDRALALAERFWPGPLTMVLARSDRVDPAVSSGRSTVAVRVPAHPVALALLSALGRPVAAPSANRFGRISPPPPPMCSTSSTAGSTWSSTVGPHRSASNQPSST